MDQCPSCPIGSQPLLPNGRSGGLRRARVAPRNRPRGPWGWLEVPGVPGRPGKVTGGRSHNPFHQGEDKGYLGSGNYDGNALLREETRADNIRPYPPRQLHGPFKPLDKVDAWYNDGWWEGIILHVLKESDFDLRIHQDWINKKWVIALEKTLDYLGTSNMHCDDNASSIVHFYKRMMVEIRSDEIPRTDLINTNRAAGWLEDCLNRQDLDKHP
ncbi:hypothetical protein SAY87_022509 [Trapa incisa]|uniref:Uncharacterized protein n=1 Tax=Trapa incisa TaxID=236973 RepID=A0AAN7Q4T2_9MYRT|nr:hypothetical protein SAY87_022509 [Trapa incisa]